MKGVKSMTPGHPWWTDSARCPDGPHYFALEPIYSIPSYRILMSEDLGKTWVALDQVPSPQTAPPAAPPAK
jgi:hypothetical protein